MIIKNKFLYEREKAIKRLNDLSRKYIAQPSVAGMDQTILTIKTRRASIARYGDGEFDLIFGRQEGFQKNDSILGKRLKEILKKNELSDRFLVAVPDCFGELTQFVPAAQQHWKVRLDRERIRWVRCLNTKAPYYNAQITRFYYDWADKTNCGNWFWSLKKIWDNENVLVVEGEKSRVGTGNDLFDNALTVRRILCPAESAFDRYDEILAAIKEKAKPTDLIFMALGPTATVLAYDLFRAGYWAFDAGHIDIEYEWMMMEATEKVLIPGKYVNEVAGGSLVEEATDQKYLSEIVARVGC